MPLTKQAFSAYIRQFNFRELFNDMGWNNDRTTQPIVVDALTYILQAVAEKSGFKILLCNPDPNGKIPDYSTRKKIETKVTKLFQEHLIIFCDAGKQEQIWQLVVRQSGKPAKITETRYHISQDPELLYQRASGIFFELDEEEKITIVDVTQRVAAHFHQNNEKVTRQFYDKFKKEHTSFLGFIQGIDDKVNRDWYASLMLNRLMFCYFVQKKGFLDNNKNYLREKLKACRERKGKNKFYSFYRNFLLALFHEGLGAPEHDEELKEEIGRIPYLNGGLFDEHELEKIYGSIDIDDKAFENIFDFFDQYEWHLDTRATASGKDINPDVIGYIFEKYINDRAQMGAYYTKEDITDYIAKNCILPYLFDETKRQYPQAFAPQGELWQSVRESNDNYIYEAVKKGVGQELPPEVAAGLTNVGQRGEWNKPAPESHALPTEIWREVIDRRKRYAEVKTKIEQGEITAINDFITYNLDIRQFAQDAVENTTDPGFLKAFYKALTTATIIDPTCGSGAFLFAAMNILEPLYAACIQRMDNFALEAPKGKHKFFEETLAEVKAPEHPNLQYFIYKSIILRNLYGVDIMKEAVEIAKLRLFLKLVATVEADYRKPNLGLEPLPDIDFNIRAGNTLVGFATERELAQAFSGTMDFDRDQEKLKEKCDIVARTFSRYKEIQLSYGDDYKEFKKAKEELNKRLKELNRELNLLLHKQSPAIPYAAWLETHQPFHWFAEFYEIVHDKGGFDVIIGNPPYVEYSKVKSTYLLKDYSVEKSGNLYAFIFERCFSLLNSNGGIGLIVPHSIASTYRPKELQKLLINRSGALHLSYFSRRPGKLFDGVDQCLCIVILGSNKERGDPQFFSTTYKRWYTEERSNLFEKLNYSSLLLEREWDRFAVFPKLGIDIENFILRKISQKKILGIELSKTGEEFFTHRIARYFIKTIDYAPFFWSEKGGERKSDDYKIYSLQKAIDRDFVVGVLNSSLFYWFWRVMYDGYHCGKDNIESFPLGVNEVDINLKQNINTLSQELVADFKEKSTRKRVYYKNSGLVEYDEFDLKQSKGIIDKIDTILAKHYGFTDEELDFIINYDIKFRMGKELENGEDE